MSQVRHIGASPGRDPPYDIGLERGERDAVLGFLAVEGRSRERLRDLN